MKSFKAFIIAIVAVFVLVPISAQARGPKISFSFNFFDPCGPCYVQPLPPPIVEVPVYVPCPPPPLQRETITREYHYLPQCQDDYSRPVPPHYPHRYCY